MKIATTYTSLLRVRPASSPEEGWKRKVNETLVIKLIASKKRTAMRGRYMLELERLKMIYPF
jgi:hypothetical protein